MDSFKSICSSHYFIIPENQRGFSWKQEHVTDIFDDLILAGSNSHYMGPIIVTRTNIPDFQDDSRNTIAEFTLEDGQQRITTFFIIINEIKHRIVELKGDASLDSDELDHLIFFQHNGEQLRLQNKNSDLEDCYRHILTGRPALPRNQSPPMKAMVEVTEYIHMFFSSLNLDHILDWKNKVLNQAKFIWVDLSLEGINRYLAFDAINSRGLPLSEFDKIKNFCVLVDQVRNLDTHPETAWYKAICQLQLFDVGTRNYEKAFITDLFETYHDEYVGQSDVHKQFVDKYKKLLSEHNSTLVADYQSFVRLWEDYAKSFGFITTSKRDSCYGNLCLMKTGTWLNRLDNMTLRAICRKLLTVTHLKMDHAHFDDVARAISACVASDH